VWTAWWLLPFTPRGQEKKWFTPGILLANNYYYYYNTNNSILIIGSKACELLNDIILNKHQFKKLSPSHQTSSLESYHSVVNHFAPKLMSFSYVGMHCRFQTIIQYCIHLFIITFLQIVTGCNPFQWKLWTSTGCHKGWEGKNSDCSKNMEILLPVPKT